MSAAVVGSVVGIAAGVNSLTGGSITNALGFGPSTPSGAQAQASADPFSPYRAGLGAQYAMALSPGQSTDPTKMPGYSQWMSGVMQPALGAVQAQDAASGRAFSGQEQQDLQKTAQQGYYGFMTDYMNRLAQGSGAVNNPAQAAALGLGQTNANQQGFMQGLGGIAQGVSGLANQFNSPAPGSSGGTPSNWGDPTMTSGQWQDNASSPFMSVDMGGGPD